MDLKDFLKDLQMNFPVDKPVELRQEGDASFVYFDGDKYVINFVTESTSLEEHKFIIAHEYGHIYLEHFETSYFTKIFETFLHATLMFTIGFMVLSFSTTIMFTALLVWASARITSHLVFKRSREAELEADKFAYKVVRGGTSYFETKNQVMDKIAFYLFGTTHPLAQTRINHLKNYEKEIA